MNKTELIEEIADKANGSKSEAQRYFEAFTDVVESALKKDDQVQITGFGKFYVQKREAREGVNPQTKQRISAELRHGGSRHPPHLVTIVYGVDYQGI